MPPDLLISGGVVVDGTGKDAVRADIAIEDDKIVGIGEGFGPATRILRVDGRVVCPGFIEIHSHSDISILRHPQAEAFIRQGVTTILNGNCGASVAPFASEADRRESSTRRGILSVTADELEWLTFNEYLHATAGSTPSVNVGSLVGHGRLRAAVMGYEQRKPTDNELAEMKSLLSQALDAGAAGLSSGLVFPPGAYADTSEITELCRVVAAHDRLYATHMRGYGAPFLASTREALEIAALSGCRLEISHAAPYYPAWGDSSEFLRLVNQSSSAGIEIMFDDLPCTRGIGDLTRILPPYLQGQAANEIAAALRGKKTREGLRAEILDPRSPDWGSTISLLRGGASDGIIVMTAIGNQTQLVSLKELAHRAGRDPLDAALDLLLENINSLVQMVEWSEEDLTALLTDPLALLCIDSELVSPHEPLFHPKDVGTFPSVIRKYVRGESRTDVPDRGSAIFSMEEAIRRMTSAPAKMMRLKDRGVLREGMSADIVIFDSASISDRGTYVSPNQPPVGLDYVVVNGQIALDCGTVTGARSGTVLRW